MNVQLGKVFEDFSSSIQLSHILIPYEYKHYKPNFKLHSQQNINLQQNTSVILDTIKRKVMSKNKILELIKERSIKVDDRYLLASLLEKLDEERLGLLYHVMDYLLENNYKFSIEVYESDGDLEDLYFVIHFVSETDDEKIDEEILKLANYKRSIDKNKLLWFVGFTREIEDV